jgi:tetratricopeptide (TPR) repeat protein
VLSPESARSTARLEAEIGRPAQALNAWQQTAAAGADDADLHLGVARAERALGRSEPSRLAYRKALERRAEFAPALVELGALEIESGDAERGLQLLGSARKLESDLDTRRHLARALEKGGDPESAHAVLAELPQSEQTGADLTRMASLQAARGDRKAARATLERAVHRDPYDPSLRAERARLLESLGDASAAAEREIATLLTGSRAQPGAETRFQPSALTLDELVNTFAVQVPGAQRRTVSPLGVREPGDWRTWLDRISRPKSPDLPAIGQALEAAIDARFIGVAAPPLDDPALRSHVDPLFDFGNEASRSAQSIATINGVLGTDGVVVAMLRTVPEDPENPLCAEGDFEMHMRLLMGREPEIATILSNVECVADGAEVFGTWNWIAGVAYGLLGLILAMPVLRGWGTLHVSIQLPNHTKGFFSIHITTRPDQVRRDRVDKKTGREKTQSIRRIPDVFRRYERHMAGRETPFRWTPARKSGYIVTVAGPLLDAQGKEIIGHFFEEQKVRVRRGAVTKVTFDFRPKECAVEMKVLAGGRPAAGGKVAVRGDSTSLRYTRDGVAYLYLGLGSYTLVVGSHDAATEIPLEVHSLESSIPMSVDLEDAHTAFSGCADAVEPYLQGDLATAADVLEAHGDATAAHRIRALHLRALGRDEEAAVELEAAGEIEGAAELRADGADFAGSADLYEQAGDFQNAADAYRAAGDYAEAARCFERIYDYENAIECWREIGDSEREMLLLEKIGEFMDAGRIAHELGDVERAIGNLQKIDRRHREYAEACRLIGEMLSQRGDHELGVAKFEEALDACGPESATIEMLEGHAAALEAAGRKRESLAAWEAVARRDARRSGAATRIEALRREVGETETTGAQAAASEPVESRYERLEEIGRGGMGVVYKARDRRLGRVVALKELPDNLKEHPNAVALFEREARAAAALNHGNIVTLFDAGEENGSYFITMELLEGKPLNAILERHGSLSTRDVARLGTQIASGLHYAHEQRIVHRDIKASNLFFTKDHTVKIMDFGIAKSLEEVRRSTTVVGGTPYYMAPEQAAGEAVDHRADLYAFGVTLFQLATGTVPFADGDVTYRHRHEAPPDPRELDASIPERLARLVLALMEKRVEDRPESAAVAWNELRAILAEQVDA